MSRRRTIGQSPLDHEVIEGNPLEALLGSGSTAGEDPTGDGDRSLTSENPSPTGSKPAVPEPKPPSRPGLEPGARRSAGDDRLFLTFRLAGGVYAIDVLRVREILPYEQVTRIPHPSPWIRGVVNVRGAVVPVIDLVRRFTTEQTECTRRTCLVILDVVLDNEPTAVGVLADAVDEVIPLALAPVNGRGRGRPLEMDCLVGFAKVDDAVILVLDVDRMVAFESLGREDGAVKPSMEKMSA